MTMNFLGNYDFVDEEWGINFGKVAKAYSLAVFS